MLFPNKERKDNKRMNEGNAMALTETEKFLIDGLKLFDISEDDQLGIFLTLRTEEEQAELMDYLAANRQASDQEILKKTLEIMKKHRA